ncbi:MAG: DedA family protein [Propionibacteriaceae bacterium]|nr:DedA family protein [Propionibacteriaceae bacterium]
MSRPDAADQPETPAQEPPAPVEAEPAADASPADEAEPAAEDGPWWADPAWPWSHRPTRADLVCWIMIAVVGVYGLAIAPARAVLIGYSPPLAAAITGGRTSVVATGAWIHVRGGALVLWWALAALSLIKFSWVYWWAGHRWGEGIITMLAGQTAWSQRRAARAVKLTRRWWPLAVALTFLPVPLPMPIVYAVVGAAGVELGRFLIPVLASSLVFQAGYLALGWWIGQPAVDLVDLYARYMWYVTLAILVGMVGLAWWRSRRRKTEAPPDHSAQPPAPAAQPPIASTPTAERALEPTDTPKQES